MKRITTLLLFAAWVLVLSAKDTPQVKVVNSSLSVNNGKVNVSFDVAVSKLGSNYKLILTPIAYADEQQQALPALVLMGKRKQTSEKRRHEAAAATSPSVTRIVGKDKSIRYQHSFDYKPWMGSLSMKLDCVFEGCCNEQPLPALALFADRLIHYVPRPVVETSAAESHLSPLQAFDRQSSFLYPASDYVRRDTIFQQLREHGALMVNFRQGYHTIDSTYLDNRAALAQMNRALDLIAADSCASLKKIVIVGLASPEGTLDKNEKLAALRAQELKYFVGARTKYNPDLFDVVNGSEDWEGLCRMVEASRMPYRWLVLETIDKYPVRGGREVELMKLKGGEPYRYMLEHFFPKLRNAGYIQMYYDYHTKPDLEAEHIDRGNEHLAQGRYTEALAELLQVANQNKVANAIGVCYLMTGNYEGAETYFLRAIGQGDKQAEKNMEQLRQKRKAVIQN